MRKTIAKHFNSILKGIGAFFLIFVIALSPGCVKSEVLLPVAGESMTVEKEAQPNINDVTVQDNDHIYLYDDEDSVVTMYLTVRRGNKAENTDNAWKAVNEYSIFDYEKLGIDRYKVEAILQVGDENGPVAGELGYGLKIPNAIVQMRGASTTTMAQKSYKIMLKDNAGEWRQQHTIALNKHVFDGLRFRNKLGFDLMKQIPNMIALRTQFVHLYVKDETEAAADIKFVDYGLYTQVEQPNTRFLKNHGLDSDGQLYKLNFFEYYRYEDTIKLKSDPSYNLKKFEELLEIKGDDDHSKLIEMLNDLNDYSKPIEEVFEKYFDAENYFTWLAFNILTGNVDTQSRNYYLYSPLNSKKWYYIPWDCDMMLSRYEYTVVQGPQEIGHECGISNYWGDVVHNRVLRIPKYRAMLDEKIQQLHKIITVEKIEKMMAQYRAATEKYVYSMPDVMYERLTPEEYNDVFTKLTDELELNYKLYYENLKKPLPFYVDLPVEKDGKMSFQWEVAYDLDGQDITYSFELARDYLFKDTVYRQDGLEFPTVTTPKLVPGQYFFRVYAKNEDGQTQPAMTYYVVDSIKYFATECFYVLANGEVVLDGE